MIPNPEQSKKHGRFQDNAQTERTMRVRARAGGRASWRSAGREGRAGELQVSTKAEETDDGRERSGKPTPRTDGRTGRAPALASCRTTDADG